MSNAEQPRQSLKFAKPEDDVIRKRWIVYNNGDGPYHVEDTCVITPDGFEVIGCSEWMRCADETFDHIVKLHNDWLESAKL